MKLRKTLISTATLLALISGAAFAKQPAAPAPKPAATQTQNTSEGVLQALAAKSVTIKENGKPMTFDLASNVAYSPDRKSLKTGEKIRVEMDKQHHVTRISKA